MENVPEVIGTNNLEHFSNWVARLDEWGYKSKWQVMNGTDFNMPQNRKRCFMVSVLGDYFYNFPTPTGCSLRLKDMLEPNVDDKYYLSDDIIQYFVKHTEDCIESGNGFRFAPTDGGGTAKCITTRAGARMDDNFIYRCECIGNLTGGKWDSINESCRRVYSTEQASPTVTTCAGGNQEVKILEPQLVGGFGEKKSNSGTQWYQQDRVYSTDTVAMCHCAGLTGGSYNYMEGVKIRKLTPKECFRLMGVSDADYEKIAKNQSDSSLYHLAGDSIITNCLMAIFKEMM